jgi:hypothetical protein
LIVGRMTAIMNSFKEIPSWEKDIRSGESMQPFQIIVFW